ncbi:MAG TPA: hypothetical protein DHW61_14880 [Lachnoclostridium phytofermentans]|uniref:Copper amine oxidase-like N-terminal domain-containing protein n=2 Tax=Lachnoclostridium TaxID=1506553 RepID=A0A3D2XAW1_9FIRM|nr:hypothetical protein [Lachnoclostridium phytofermentans]
MLKIKLNFEIPRRYIKEGRKYMYKRFKSIGVFKLIVSILANSNTIVAKSNMEIVFKDKNLESALYKFYNYQGIFTTEKAAELSDMDSYIDLENSGISDLDGLQYFGNAACFFLSNNNLKNLKPLSKFKELLTIIIDNNSIKGKEFENALYEMGKVENLSDLLLNNNGISDIKILDKIGNISNYKSIEMENNYIHDISILKEAANLRWLDLSNNRITDVSPIKDLKKLTSYIDLHDNCIIDYKPIKHLFDEMYKSFDYPLYRYDFYSNPVNYKYYGTKIDFPHLTVYYKNQGYAEAVPLLKALGGSAKYDKNTGTLTCKYEGKVLVFKDFSKKYTMNDKEKSLKYPMRRMQYDLAYVPVKDICEVLGLEYNVVKKRDLYQGKDAPRYAPKLVEIRKAVTTDITFPDKNLQTALSKIYDWNEPFTVEKARELSQKKKNIFLDYTRISDMEGIQYFEGLIQVSSFENDLKNLSPLSKLPNLEMIDICKNVTQGKKFEKILSDMGSCSLLEVVQLERNKLTDISFLSKIGKLGKYLEVRMEDNNIKDVSLLKKAAALVTLDLSNNRITDVTPLKNLKNLTYIDLRDNCIIDYKPIKHLLDAMYADRGNETGLERYDYYKNPVNFTYGGKTIQFPYLTVYYKYQAYAEAIPLFKALGGSAKYNKKTGTLTCEYNGNVLIMKDFSKKVTLNEKKFTLEYPMRRMQYDLAYIPVKDVCEILGSNYNVVETRKIPHDFQYVEYAPKVVEISEE